MAECVEQVKLFTEDGVEAVFTGYQCKECNKVYFAIDSARRCCTIETCKKCGKKLTNLTAMNLCTYCHTEYLVDKAQLVEYVGQPLFSLYGGDYYHDEDILGHEFYTKEYMENLDDYSWIFFDSCPMEFKLDIDNILENALEEHYEEAGDNITDEKELRDFVSEWNKKQNVTTYFCNYKKKVDLTQKMQEWRKEWEKENG